MRELCRKRIPRGDRGYQRAVYERIFRGAAVLDQSNGSRRHPHFVRSVKATIRYMADAMDESWRAMRGMESEVRIAIASLSYDEASRN